MAEPGRFFRIEQRQVVNPGTGAARQEPCIVVLQSGVKFNLVAALAYQGALQVCLEPGELPKFIDRSELQATKAELDPMIEELRCG